MLDLNAIVLEVCGSDRPGIDVLERVAAVVDAARKTRDLRFVEVTTWFAECLETALLGTGAPATPSRQKIEDIRRSGRTPIEVFVPRLVGGVRVEVPFVLSPHWRY